MIKKSDQICKIHDQNQIRYVKYNKNQIRYVKYMIKIRSDM